MTCVFCQIIEGELPAAILEEWSDAIAIYPLNPVTPGHLLVIPRLHVPDALADPAITAMVMARAAQIAEGPCNLITSVGHAATQTVFHLHAHIVPRHGGDGLALPWTGQRVGHAG